MKSIIVITSLVLVLSLPLTQSRKNDIEFIKQTCKQTPNPKLCESTLILDPRSADANVKTLALITVDALHTKAKATLTRVQDLLKSAKHPKQREIFTICAHHYNALIQADIPVAIEGIRKGGYKFAETSLNDAVVEAKGCEKKFSAGKSPITDLNHAVRDVAAVASSLTRMLM